MNCCLLKCQQWQCIICHQLYTQAVQAQQIQTVAVKDPVVEIRAQLSPELHDYANVFHEHLSDVPPMQKTWDHAINLQPDHKPKRAWLVPLRIDEPKKVHIL